MKRFFRILFSVFCLLSPALSQSTYDFLRTDVSARAAALNGSFVSMTDDPNIIFYNPAGLASITRQKASVSFLKHLLDVNAGSLSYAQELEGVGKIGGGILYINYGDFTQTDPSSNIVGTFSAGEFAAVAGIGIPIDEQTSVGVNLKGIYSSIAGYHSSAVAVDIGVLYAIPAELMTLGASILNFGKQLSSYVLTKESLPLDVVIGVTKQPEHLPVLLNLDFHKLNERQDNLFQHLSAFTFGAEFLMSESVRFRVGYNNEQRKELKVGTGAGLAGFSIGAGLLYQEYQFDYAFNSYGKIGGLHRISLSMSL